MTTRTKKLLSIVVTTVGIALFVGAAILATIQSEPGPLMLPFFAVLWVLIIWGLATMVQDYRATGDSEVPVTFRTHRPLVACKANQALATGRNFTTSLSTPEGIKKVTGKVLSVDLVEGAQPERWQIAMRLKK